jgi:hypothetical protein
VDDSGSLTSLITSPDFDGLDPEALAERQAIQAESQDADSEPEILILKDRPLVTMQSNQPDPVIPGLAIRRNSTLISSAGGTGKTCMMLQAGIESELGLPVWGCEDFASTNRHRWLYVNGEDSLQNIDYWLSRLLLKYELNTCPVDLFPICETQAGQFILTSTNAARLAGAINAGPYDGLIIDTGIAVMPPGIKFIDPIAIRAWLRSTLGLIQRQTNASIIMGVHDNKAGQPVSGTADWSSFSRLALHLETAEESADGTTLTVTKIKANLRWPYRKFTLLRDPHTLTCTVSAIDRIGDHTAAPTSPAEVARLLARIVRNEIMPLPSEQRTKQAVIATLCQRTHEQRITRQQVRDFAETQLETTERKLGRTYAKVVTGIRDDAPGGDDA